jgi:hypothetical protein
LVQHHPKGLELLLFIENLQGHTNLASRIIWRQPSSRPDFSLTLVRGRQ